MSYQNNPPVGPGYSPKDPDTAFLLELVGGFFGLLGLGHLYVGRTNDGLIRLVAWLLYNAAAWCLIVLTAVFIIGLCAIPVQLAIQIGVPIWSALKLKRELTGVNAPASNVPPITPALAAIPPFHPPYEAPPFQSPPVHPPHEAPPFQSPPVQPAVEQPPTPPTAEQPSAGSPAEPPPAPPSAEPPAPAGPSVPPGPTSFT